MVVKAGEAQYRKHSFGSHLCTRNTVLSALTFYLCAAFANSSVLAQGAGFYLESQPEYSLFWEIVQTINATGAVSGPDFTGWFEVCAKDDCHRWSPTQPDLLQAFAMYPTVLVPSAVLC